MNRQQAINYLLSSGFSEEQINTIEQAFKQESAIRVDCISRTRAIERLKLNLPISQGADNSRDRHRYMQALADIQAIREMPSVTPQEPQTFKWCDTCKEYDQEKHCCHRWSKVIRDTVEEMKQEPILDKIRDEIEQLPTNYGYVNFLVF